MHNGCVWLRSNIRTTTFSGGVALAAQTIPTISIHFSARLSSLRHIRAPYLNRSTDLDAIWQVHLWGPMTGKGKFGVESPAKTCNIANCSQTVNLMLPPGEYKRAISPFAKLLCFFCFFKFISRNRLATIDANRQNIVLTR